MYTLSTCTFVISFSPCNQPFTLGSLLKLRLNRGREQRSSLTSPRLHKKGAGPGFKSRCSDLKISLLFVDICTKLQFCSFVPNDLYVALLAVCVRRCAGSSTMTRGKEGVIKLILRRMLTLRDVTHLAKAVL